MHSGFLGRRKKPRDDSMGCENRVSLSTPFSSHSVMEIEEGHSLCPQVRSGSLSLISQLQVKLTVVRGKGDIFNVSTPRRKIMTSQKTPLSPSLGPEVRLMLKWRTKDVV